MICPCATALLCDALVEPLSAIDVVVHGAINCLLILLHADHVEVSIGVLRTDVLRISGL